MRDNNGIVFVAVQQENWNFGELTRPILVAENASDAEIEHMQRFRWEFFAINVGSSTFKGAGTSLKKPQLMFSVKALLINYMDVDI